MASKAIAAPSFSHDTQEFLLLLHEHKVNCLMVGGNAVIFHGYARLTGDVDIFYDMEHSNVIRLHSVLLKFWGGKIPGIKHTAELEVKGQVIQFGVPPNRIDLVNRISGVTFEKAWSNRKAVSMRIKNREVSVNYIGLSDLIKNKAAAGRSKDLDDLKFLRHASRK